MVWKGVIIEESLGDKKLLDLVKIINTYKNTLENEEEKGFLHFHKIELEDSRKDKFIPRAKQAIKQGWYMHICKGNKMAVIFRNRIFEFTDKEKTKINQARDYGLSVGIKKEQLTFENLIKNPHD